MIKTISDEAVNMGVSEGGARAAMVCRQGNVALRLR